MDLKTRVLLVFSIRSKTRATRNIKSFTLFFDTLIDFKQHCLSSRQRDTSVTTSSAMASSSWQHASDVPVPTDFDAERRFDPVLGKAVTYTEMCSGHHDQELSKFQLDAHWGNLKKANEGDEEYGSDSTDSKYSLDPTYMWRE